MAARSKKVLSVPFSGSKRSEYSRFIRSVIDALPEGAKIFDVFGGSCLISINAKRDRPDLVVTVNDFDNFCGSEMLKAFECAKLCELDLDAAGFVISHKRQERTEELREIISRRVESSDLCQRSKFIVYRRFIFSACASSIESESFEKCCKKVNYYSHTTNIETAREYAAEFAKIDHVRREDFAASDLAGFDLIILDPPYLNSVQKQYEKGHFFGLANTIQMIRRIPIGCPFMLFNQNGEDMAELLAFGGYNIAKIWATNKSIGRNIARVDSCILAVKGDRLAWFDNIKDKKGRKK